MAIDSIIDLSGSISGILATPISNPNNPFVYYCSIIDFVDYFTNNPELRRRVTVLADEPCYSGDNVFTDLIIYFALDNE